MELSKKERKILRSIIAKGMQREFAQGLEKAEAVIQGWRQNKPGDHQEHYHLFYNTIHDFDKHIAERYDYLRPWKYATVVLEQLIDGLLTIDDLDELPENLKARFIEALKR